MHRYTPPIPLLVLISLAAGIVALGWLLYRSQQEICRTKAEYNLTAIADLKVSELSLWRKERLADANTFFGNSAFSDLVRRCAERPQDRPLQEELRTWLGHFQSADSYDRVALFDAAGNKWMSFSDMTRPPSSAAHQRAREALSSGQPMFTDFYRTDRTGQVRLSAFVPIFDGQAGGRPLGVLMLRTDPSVCLYPMIQCWPTPSQTAETLLIRREGNEAVYLNELKCESDPPLTHRVSLESTDVLAVKAALGQEGIVEGVDGRGVHVLAAVRAVPGSPWWLVAQMDVAEVYAPMREWVWLTVLFVCALVCGVAVAVVVVYRVHAVLASWLWDGT